jgi:carboxylesterase type B
VRVFRLLFARKRAIPAAAWQRASFPNGVPHGGEIVYVMDTGDIYEGTKNTFTKADQEYARSVSDYWFEFAQTGKPVSRGSPEWPSNNGDRDSTMQFGETIAIKTNFMKARLNVFIGAIKITSAISNRKSLPKE